MAPDCAAYTPRVSVHLGDAHGERLGSLQPRLDDLGDLPADVLAVARRRVAKSTRNLEMSSSSKWSTRLRNFRSNTVYLYYWRK